MKYMNMYETYTKNGTNANTGTDFVEFEFHSI